MFFPSSTLSISGKPSEGRYKRERQTSPPDILTSLWLTVSKVILPSGILFMISEKILPSITKDPFSLTVASAKVSRLILLTI